MISQVFHAQNVLSLFNSVTTTVAVVSLGTLTMLYVGT